MWGCCCHIWLVDWSYIVILLLFALAFVTWNPTRRIAMLFIAFLNRVASHPTKCAFRTFIIVGVKLSPVMKIGSIVYDGYNFLFLMINIGHICMSNVTMTACIPLYLILQFHSHGKHSMHRWHGSNINTPDLTDAYSSFSPFRKRITLSSSFSFDFTD